MPRNHFVVGDAGASKSLSLDRIPRRRGALMMTAALILECMSRLAVFVDQQKVDPLRVDAAIGCRVFAPQDLTQRNLSHHLPARLQAQDDAIELLEDTRFAPVKKRLDREVGSHDDPQLIRSVRLFEVVGSGFGVG